MRIASQLIKLTGAAAVLLLTFQSADAQQVCTLRAEAMVQLEKQFEEQVAGRGLAANGKAMIELFISESGSWSVLVSEVNGRSCIIAAGEDWQQIPLRLGDPA